MFKCSKCEALQDENKFLREQMKALTDRLMAIASPQAYGAIYAPIASNEFYGGDEDEMIAYSPYGEKITVKKVVDS